MTKRLLCSVLAAMLVAALTMVAAASPATAATMTFSNPGLISIPGGGQTQGPANPYPSPITVAGMSGPITNVIVEFPVLLHSAPDDLDILLVSPENKGVVLISDAGGSFDVSGLIRFADGSPAPPNDGPLVAGSTFGPSNVSDGVADTLPGAQPIIGQSFSHFDGDDPNGTWELRVFDDAAGDVGDMTQGWRLIVETADDPPPPPPPPPPGGGPCEGVPEDGFVDVGPENVHEANIDCLVFFGVTVGTTPTTFNPQGTVTRGQMASFVARAIESTGTALPENPPDAFDDDAGNVHEPRINQLAAAGVIGGNGEVGRTYSPQAGMRRDHMASFMFEADAFIFGDPLAPGPDAFTDDNGNPHETAINALAAEAVIAGRGGGIFDPNGTVTRAQMASFLARLLGLWAEFGAPPMPPA